MATGTGAGLAGMAALVIVGFLVVGVRSGRADWGRLLGSAVWDPDRGHFGALAMIWGSAAVAAVALLLAAPLGWAAAVAVHEVAPPRWRRLLRTGVELLAVVPSIVYGLLGVAYVRPLVARLAGVPGGDSLLAAGLVLAVMVLPTITAVSVDALAGVPASARESAAALGLTPVEVVRAAVLPRARAGMAAGALLGLARAVGETVAVFLLVGRADGRLPRPGGILHALVHPGQTLTTKLNGPEPVLAGTSGAHWAALCALGLVLLAAVAVLTFVGLRRVTGAGRSRSSTAGLAGRLAGGMVAASAGLRRPPRPPSPPDQASSPPSPPDQVHGEAPPVTVDRTDPVPPPPGPPPAAAGAGRPGRRRGGRHARDRAVRAALGAMLAVPLGLVTAISVVVLVRGRGAFHPSFWWRPATGASGGGVRDQLVGTLLLVGVAGLLAAPVGLCLGLVTAEYAGARVSRPLRSATLALGGVPSILLGLGGHWLFTARLGWGTSWLAGSVVLAVVAVPPVAVAVTATLDQVPAERREATLALGLRRDQLVRSVLVPAARPGLVTGLLLGLARAAGETAPLLFTATVFSGAAPLPSGVRDAPVTALTTHVFALAQDASDPAALRTAWNTSLVLVAVAGALLLAAVPARRRLEGGRP